MRLPQGWPFMKPREQNKKCVKQKFQFLAPLQQV
jgi:hypothetical protein